MVEFPARKEIQSLFKGSSRDWSWLFAVRSALRVLPLICHADDVWLSRFALVPFRALITSWTRYRIVSHQLVDAFGSPPDVPSLAVDAAREAGIANLAFADERAIESAVNATLAAFTAYHFAAFGEQDVKEAIEALWQSCHVDWQWMNENHALPNALLDFKARALWSKNNPPAAFDDAWLELQTRLLAIDQSYAIWIEWFDRRISGAEPMFDIPGDRDGKQDKWLRARFAEVSTRDFWDLPAISINSELQRWVDEARARATGSEPTDILPPQNPNAIAFHQDANGKIAIDASVDLGALRTDPDARDRHSELRRIATALKARCQGSNAGARLTGLLENFVEALGERNEEQRPSLLVQRGNRLDVEYRAYNDPAHLLSPLADDVLLDLGSLVSAIHMHVMSEPVLRDRATAMLGPDAKPVLIAPDEIKLVVQEADERGILADGVREIVEEAADIAPAVPDPENRFTIWSTETLTNLIIEAFTIALRHPIETAIVGGVAIILPTGLDLCTAVVAAGYLLHRRAWVESRLGNSPTWKALFIELCNRMDKFIPPHE